MGRTRPRGRRRVPTIWKVPDELWKRIAPLLPLEEFRPTGGRPSTPPRRILDGVLYVLRTGGQWKAMPREYGSGSTVHRRFQRWVEQGCWETMWRRLLQAYDDEAGLAWTWQSADASLHKAPLGGEKNRAQSNRPRQKRHQAPSSHRRRRAADRHCPHCRQCAWQDRDRGVARRPPPACPGHSHPAPVSRQGLRLCRCRTCRPPPPVSATHPSPR